MAKKLNHFNVWGYGDNRPDDEKEKGARRPCVCIYRSNPSNLWQPDSVDFTPRQARLAAAALIKAADAADANKNSKRQFV